LNQDGFFYSTKFFEKVNFRNLKNISSMPAEHGFLILTTQSGKRFKSDIENDRIQHFEINFLKEKLTDFGLKPVSSYKTGFPFYNIQKFLHEKIENTAYSFQKGSQGNSFLGKLIFSITYNLFLLTPKSGKLGPQIFIVAEKEFK